MLVLLYFETFLLITVLFLSLLQLTSSPFDVRSTNDFPPVFQVNTLHTSVYENVSIASIIHTVIATDDDAGNAGIVSYALYDQLGTFSISNTTGEITVLKSLDRETTSYYLINVSAVDLAPSPFNFKTVELLNITVIDINDNEPMFINLPSSPISALETFNEDHIIYTLLATDADENENALLTFTLLEANCTRISMWSNGSFYVNGE